MATLKATLDTFMGAKPKRAPRRHLSIGGAPSKALDTLRAHVRVMHVDREPIDGWFITLKAGWRSHYDPRCPVHCFGATTLRDALRDVRASLPCRCEQCIREGVAD